MSVAARNAGGAAAPPVAPAAFELEHKNESEELVVRLTGAWRLGAPRPDVAELERELSARPARRVVLVAEHLESWDTALLVWVRAAARAAAEHGAELERSSLPEGIATLLRLADEAEAPERARHAPPPAFLARVGTWALGLRAGAHSALRFLGRLTLAFGRLVVLRARFRASDLRRLVQEAGADAVPIITLVSVIVGLILAFVGAVQLRLFGADLYVADLVAIATVREMGAMVVGIVMAGRTGAAYAAELATMKVTEEIDALRTFGIPVVDFLVLPRVVALSLMVPLLCLYSMLLGIAGGALVGVGMLGISPQLYLDQTVQSVTLADLYGGLFHGAVYGLLIGVIGCLRGFGAGNDAGAVGYATTSAVVTAIVAIVVADGIMAVVFDVLGI